MQKRSIYRHHPQIWRSGVWSRGGPLWCVWCWGCRSDDGGPGRYVGHPNTWHAALAMAERHLDLTAPREDAS